MVQFCVGSGCAKNCCIFYKHFLQCMQTTQHRSRKECKVLHLRKVPLSLDNIMCMYTVKSVVMSLFHICDSRSLHVFLFFLIKYCFWNCKFSIGCELGLIDYNHGTLIHIYLGIWAMLKKSQPCTRFGHYNLGTY